MAEVSFQGVKKRYPNGFEAIHGIDLAIEDGEFVVLVGPSGCGKSTLLRMVAGLESVTEGEIRIGDRRVNELEPSMRDIAMVFQNYALYPHMSVFDNMAYGLRNRGTAKDDIERRVQEAARVLELSELLSRKPRQLSGGQRQRVAMGRAIVREPKVFLFDEPLSNLDAKLRVQMRIEVKRLQRDLRTTSIYVTHDQVEAMTMADRLVVVNGGAAEQVGTPLEVYAHPETTFVASFIGSPAMNFLDASVAEGGGLVLDGGSEPVAAGVDASLAGREVILGVRPEDVVVGDAGVALGTLRVDLVEPLGADSLVHGRLEAGAQVTIRASGTATHPDGTALVIAAPPDKLHLFDRESGRAIG